MKFLLLFLSSVAMAQTAAVPPLPVPIPARVVPAQTVTVNVPRNGGKMTFTIPAQTLPAQASSTAATAAPITGTVTVTLSCTGPDMQHLLCSVVTQ